MTNVVVSVGRTQRQASNPIHRTVSFMLRIRVRKGRCLAGVSVGPQLAVAWHVGLTFPREQSGCMFLCFICPVRGLFCVRVVFDTCVSRALSRMAG